MIICTCKAGYLLLWYSLYNSFVVYDATSSALITVFVAETQVNVLMHSSMDPAPKLL